MTLFHWIAIGLACLYGGASALAGVHQLKGTNIPRWSAIGMLLAGVWVVLSAALAAANSLGGLAVLPGLLLLHLLAVGNGYHMYGQIHVTHHLVRLALSLIIAMPFAL